MHKAQKLGIDNDKEKPIENFVELFYVGLNFKKDREKKYKNYMLGKGITVIDTYLKYSENKFEIFRYFENFLSSKFNRNLIIAIDFNNKLKELTNNYRNKASHTELMDKLKATKCIKVTQEILIIWLNSIK